MPNKLDYESLLIGLSMITMGSTLTALMRPQTSLLMSIKYWAAGIVAGILVMLIQYRNNYTGVWWDLAKISVSTFVTTVYPMAEKLVKFYFVKKLKNLPDDIIDPPDTK
jgi:hypothetical protein